MPHTCATASNNGQKRAAIRNIRSKQRSSGFLQHGRRPRQSRSLFRFSGRALLTPHQAEQHSRRAYCQPLLSQPARDELVHRHVRSDVPHPDISRAAHVCRLDPQRPAAGRLPDRHVLGFTAVAQHGERAPQQATRASRAKQRTDVNDASAISVPARRKPSRHCETSRVFTLQLWNGCALQAPTTTAWPACRTTQRRELRRALHAAAAVQYGACSTQVPRRGVRACVWIGPAARRLLFARARTHIRDRDGERAAWSARSSLGKRPRGGNQGCGAYVSMRW